MAEAGSRNRMTAGEPLPHTSTYRTGYPNNRPAREGFSDLPDTTPSPLSLCQTKPGKPLLKLRSPTQFRVHLKRREKRLNISCKLGIRL